MSRVLITVSFCVWLGSSTAFLQLFLWLQDLFLQFCQHGLSRLKPLVTCSNSLIQMHVQFPSFHELQTLLSLRRFTWLRFCFRVAVWRDCFVGLIVHDRSKDPTGKTSTIYWTSDMKVISHLGFSTLPMMYYLMEWSVVLHHFARFQMSSNFI